jgi:hypothetical protein
VAWTVKESACHAGDAGLIPRSGRSLGQEDNLEKEMATHSSILALKMSCFVASAKTKTKMFPLYLHTA